MASISKDTSTGRYRIQFDANDGKRQTLRLPSGDKKTAQSVALHVEHLLNAQITGTPAPQATASWVASLGEPLRGRMVRLVLIAPSADTTVTTLATLVELYFEQKQHGNKSSTRTNIEIVANDLYGFLGRDVDVTTVTVTSAVRFLAHYKERKLAASTIARRLRRAKTLFAFAVKRKLLTENPFAEVKAANAQPQERNAYLTIEDTQKLIDVAPPEWRCIIALARFAGLRCPSEVLMLRWSDIHFDTGKMTVTSPKTAHLPGKEYRVVPIFVRLRPYLEEAFDLAPAGTEYVVSGALADNCRATAAGPRGWVSVNLRTQMQRLTRRAGLTSWPRLFNTLRASASTDIREEFGETAESHWVGHSPAIAKRHYSRVPDVLFQAAASVQKSDANSDVNLTQKATSQVTAPEGTELTSGLEKQEVQEVTQAYATSCTSMQRQRLTLTGLEPVFLP